MSEDQNGAAYVEKLNAFARESVKRRAVAKIAEPLLQGLRAGVHHFAPAHFRALVEYLFEGEPKRAGRALKRERFRMLTLEFVCDASITDEPMTTISEFARAHGVLQQTMHARVCKAVLRSFMIAGKKLYRIAELNSLLPKHGAT